MTAIKIRASFKKGEARRWASLQVREIAFIPANFRPDIRRRTLSGRYPARYPAPLYSQSSADAAGKNLLGSRVADENKNKSRRDS